MDEHERRDIFLEGLLEVRGEVVGVYEVVWRGKEGFVREGLHGEGGVGHFGLAMLSSIVASLPCFMRHIREEEEDI